MAGTGIVYHLNRRLQLLASPDLWYLKPDFEDVTQTVAIGHNMVVPGVVSMSNASSYSINSQTQDYQQNMSTLNLTTGLGLSL
jgi:hypothetical protein